MKKLMILVGMILMAGCGGTSTPNVTGTKDDPSIQAVKALFSTSSENASITESVIDPNIPFILYLIGQQDLFPCDSGTRSVSHDGSIIYPVFNNCEFILSNITTLNTPSCIKNITLNGVLTIGSSHVGIYDGTPGSSSAMTNTVTQALSINFEMADGSIHNITSCEFNITSTTIVDSDIGGVWNTSGTICGVDISTVNNACSL